MRAAWLLLLLVGCDHVGRDERAPAAASAPRPTLPLPTAGSLPVHPLDGPYPDIDGFCIAHEFDRCTELAGSPGAAPFDQIIVFRGGTMFESEYVHVALRRAGELWVASRRVAVIQLHGLFDEGAVEWHTARSLAHDGIPIAELAVRIRGPEQPTSALPATTTEHLLWCAIGRTGRPSCTAPIVVARQFADDVWQNSAHVAGGVITIEPTQPSRLPSPFDEDLRTAHLGSHPLGFP